MRNYSLWQSLCASPFDLFSNYYLLIEIYPISIIGTIPAKLILQLTTAFKERGLCNRNYTFFYKDHLHKSNVPVLAIAGDVDLICPPEAVKGISRCLCFYICILFNGNICASPNWFVPETVKLIPEDLVTYKLFGETGGPHYAHYDLVGGRLVGDISFYFLIELAHQDAFFLI